MEQEEEHYFYGHPIYRQREQDYIKKLLKKYQNQPATEELKAQIWDELQMEKYHGRIKIPFSISMIRGEGTYPDVIEVLLDNKV